jgi:hypothetical protein
MSETPTYPNVTVHLSTGQDGNVFAVIGTVRRALDREVGTNAAVQFVTDAFACGSYDEVLRLVMSTVDVT